MAVKIHKGKIGGEVAVTAPTATNPTDVVNLGQARSVTPSTVSSTTYTLVLTDAGLYKRYDNASDGTFTIPENSTTAFSTGAVISFFQVDAGVIIFDPAGSVVVNSKDGADRTTGAGAGAQLIKVGTDEWDLIGAIE